MPAVFLLLGAFVGFLGTSARDWMNNRRATRAFLRAARRELITLEEQLSRAIEEVESASKRLADKQHLPAFTLSFRTAVYSTQLSKLRDVADPVVFEIVQVYTDITALDGIVSILNAQSAVAEGLKPPKFGDTKELADAASIFLQAVAKVGSACRVLLERLGPLRSGIHTLIEKLPE
jgi:hypothetical protein